MKRPGLDRWALPGPAVLALLVLAGCGKDAGDLYDIRVDGVELDGSGHGRAVIEFLPANGYHWNEKFPARFEVTGAKGLKVGKKGAGAAGGEFEITSKGAELILDLEVEDMGDARLAGKADFSVCNERECHVFKGVPVEVPVHAR